MPAIAPPNTTASLKARSAADAAAIAAEHRGEIAGWVGPALLFGYWLFNMLVVSPLGNFPLNKDWIYSESVSYLLRTGEFHFLSSSPSCYLHVALGAAAALLSGFSFEHLRVLTTLFGLATSLLFYATLIKLQVKRSIALLAALVLAANPLFVNRSYSFMTDVPAMFFALLSTFLMVAAIKRQRALPAAASGAALCCAIMVSPAAIAFALVPLILLVADGSTTWRFKLSLLIFGVVAPALVAVLVAGFGTVVFKTIVADYDLYYLMALAAVLVCAAMIINRFIPGKLTLILTGMLCAGLCLYTTCVTQDYMSWNRALWKATRHLERAGVSPLEIDGGPEYNHLSNPNVINADKLSDSGYIVALNKVPGCKIVATTPYVSALTMSMRQIYTLRRSQ